MIIGAAMIVVTKAGKLALQQRDNKPGIYNPGKVGVFAGTVEEGETPLEGAAREFEEELSLRLDKSRFKFVKEMYLSEKDYPTHDAPVMANIFLVDNIDPNDLDLKEGEKIIYINPKMEELEALDIEPFAKKIVAEYIQDENTST